MVELSDEKDAYAMLSICPHGAYRNERGGNLEKAKKGKTFSKLSILELIEDDDYLHLDEHVDEMKFRVEEFIP